ncbi:MAG TPA: hypothetical protein VMU80_13545 [Bryobacteraceae bacterium]|nr:hypothetical protein [Bryobacteraceae bacterium]
MRLRLRLACSVYLALAGLAFAADDMKPEAIMDRYIEVTGGKAAYEKVKSEAASGTLEITSMGLSGSLTSYRAAPDKSYTVVEFQQGKFEEGTNGSIAWAMDAMQGPRLKEGDERATALRNAALHMEAHWREFYKKAELAGTENVDGKACYKVVLTPNEGSAETRYFDKSSGLLLKVVLPVTTTDGTASAEIGLSDYRDEGGILTPHTVAQKLPGTDILVKIQSVKHNPDIPADRFDLPAAIKALTTAKK